MVDLESCGLTHLTSSLTREPRSPHAVGAVPQTQTFNNKNCVFKTDAALLTNCLDFLSLYYSSLVFGLVFFSLFSRLLYLLISVSVSQHICWRLINTAPDLMDT